MDTEVGIVLSGGTTNNAIIQLRQNFESEINEGKLVKIGINDKSILALISKIQPQNDFLGVGTAWSESIRKGYNIPTDVARQFVTCEVELMGFLPGLKSITQPPKPGDKVFEIDVTNTQEIFGIEKGNEEKNIPPTPGYIWLNTLSGYQNASIPISVEEIVMHMGVFGITGSGKSFTTGLIFEKLMKVPVETNGNVSRSGRVPMIIIDSNGDYVDYAKNPEQEKLRQNNINPPHITRFVFPDSPERGSDNTQTLVVDLSSLDRIGLSEMIMQFYAGNKDIEEMQLNGLERAIQEAENANWTNGLGDPNEDDFRPNYNRLFERDIYRRLMGLIDQAASPPNQNPNPDFQLHSGTANAIKRALNHFRQNAFEKGIFGENSTINDDYLTNLTYLKNWAIIDLSSDGAPGIGIPLRQVIVSVISNLIFKKFNEFKSRSRRSNERFKSIIFAIEEAHNFVPNNSVYKVGAQYARKILHLIATQGRKFGVSLLLISQRPAFLDDVVLSQVNSFFIHRVAPDDVSFVKKVSGGLNTTFEKQLTKLSRGELLVTGQLTKSLPIPLRIKIPQRDRIVTASAGTTEVVSGLIPENPPHNRTNTENETDDET